VLVLASTLTACGSGSTSVSAPTTAATHSTTTTTEAVADVPADVLTAYRAMWADLVTAAKTSDYQSPLLSQHASGSVVTLFVQGLARDQLNKIVTRGEPVLHPRVNSLSPAAQPARATVADCFDDTHWVEYTTSGALAKNTPGGRRATMAVLVKKAGLWKVSKLTVGATGTC
jgi:hypothetical protein